MKFADWGLLALGVGGVGFGVWAVTSTQAAAAGPATSPNPYTPPPTSIPTPATPPAPASLPPVVVELDAGATGSPVTVKQGQRLTFNAPAGGTIDTISAMTVNAPSYSGLVQNAVGQEATVVVWHDASGSHSTTIPITIVGA